MKISTSLLLFSCLFSAPGLLLVTASYGQATKVAGGGKITIDAADSELAPGYVLYHKAVVTMADGGKLTANEIKGFFTSGNTLDKAVANGSVEANVIDPKSGQKYVVTSDTGTYEPQSNTILLDDNVKSTVKSGAVVSGKPQYTVVATADHAVYDMNADTINLTGNVKTVVDNENTDGPIVQTGTAALITFGKGPDFPKIDMQQVHTELTLKQK